MIRLMDRVAGASLAGIFALALSVTAAHSTEAPDPVDTLVDSFDRIVFQAEFGQTIEPRITKWVGPLRVFLDIRAGDPTLYLRLVEAHSADLSSLTGLTIEIVPNAEDANVFMVFDRDDALLRSAADYQPTIGRHAGEIAKTLCFGIYSVNGKYEIKRAVIGIPTDRAASLGKLPACVVEEMTQVLGLPNDSDDVSPSIFNDRSTDDALTDLDRWLVRLLYDSDVVPGMERTAALAEVRSLMADPMIVQNQLPNPGHGMATAERSGSGGGDLGQDTGDSLGMDADRDDNSGLAQTRDSES